MQSTKRILLVEDDEDDQVIFTHALNKLQPTIECVIADNGKEALDKVSSSASYDLIFMDLNLPLMNGFECMQKIKAIREHTNTPIVVLTTSDNPADIERSKLLGAAMYCIKPNSLEHLYDKLKTIVSATSPFSFMLQ